MEGKWKKSGEFSANPIVDYFWPQPPMWMRHHAHDDEDWETTVKFEGETFPPEELGSENIGLEQFEFPKIGSAKARKAGAGEKTTTTTTTITTMTTTTNTEAAKTKTRWNSLF